MPSWHQQKAWRRNGPPKLAHPTLWSSYNPDGHLCVMRHASREECTEYCKRTGNIPLAPDCIRAKRDAR
jgi:hypothetical protein